MKISHVIHMHFTSFLSVVLGHFFFPAHLIEEQQFAAATKVKQLVKEMTRAKYNISLGDWLLSHPLPGDWMSI